jgi:hypothetical protein
LTAIPNAVQHDVTIGKQKHLSSQGTLLAIRWRAMGIEPIGILTLVFALFCLLADFSAATRVFILASVLGAAAAFSIGSASIQPAHFLLLFVAVSAFRQPAIWHGTIKGLSFGRPGFWLACLVVYGGLSAYFAPRIFADASLIVPLGQSDFPITSGVARLGPVSSNLTQSVYLTSDLVCFAIIAAIASVEKGFEAVVGGLLAYAMANLLFAVLDVASAALGVSELLHFFRNADYTLRNEDTVNGVKRIVGSWPEASAFAGTTLGVFGFTSTMWLCGLQPKWTGPLAGGSLLAIVLSTSSTGLFATPLCLALLYATALSRCGAHRSRQNSSFFVVLAPLVVVAVGLAIVAHADLYDQLYDYIDMALLSKSTSDSGMTRSSWNNLGIQNFFDTYGLGAGLGTARTSSFPIALLSNVGVPGTLFFLLFAVSVFSFRRAPNSAYVSDIRASARNGCFCLLIGTLVAGPTVDLGLLFFILAGLTAAAPATSEAPAPFLQLRNTGFTNVSWPLARRCANLVKRSHRYSPTRNPASFPRESN